MTMERTTEQKKVKHDYYVVIDEDDAQAVKWVHKSKDRSFYNKRVSCV